MSENVREKDAFLETFLETSEEVKTRDRKHEDGGTLGTNSRRFKTLTVYFCMFCHGAINALLGATLIDLQELLKTSTQEISTVFTWRYVGMMLGTITAGKLADRTNQHILHAFSLLLMGVTLVSASMCHNFTVFSIIIGVQGFFSGIHSVGTSAFILDLWGKDSGPYIQALHFIVMMGATACPQLAKLFLAPSKESSVEGNSINNGSTSIRHYHSPQNTSAAVSVDVVSFEKELVTLSSFQEAQVTDVRFVYMVISAFVLVGSTLHVMNICCSGCNMHHIHAEMPKVVKSPIQEEEEEAEPGQSKYSKKRHKCSYYLALGFMCFIVVFFAGLEEIFGAFLVKFSVEQLEWDTGVSRDLVSVFWGSAAASRFISTFASYWFQSKFLLGLCTIFATVFTIGMTLTLTLTSVVVWLGIISVGLSIGSLIGHVLSMGKNLISYTGVLSSMVFFSAFLGKIVTPLWVGYMLQNVGYSWFLYSSVIHACLMLLNYCLLIFVTRCRK